MLFDFLEKVLAVKQSGEDFIVIEILKVLPFEDHFVVRVYFDIRVHFLCSFEHLFVVTPALRFGSACHEVIHLNVKSLGLLGLLLVQQFIRFGDQEEVVAAFFLGRPVRTNLFGHMCSKKYENIINFKEA